MLEILQFIFSSFWALAGTAILLGIAVQGAVALVAVLFGRAIPSRD